MFVSSYRTGGVWQIDPATGQTIRWIDPNGEYTSGSFTMLTVPEPSGILLGIVGLLTLFGWNRFFRKRLLSNQ